MVQDGADRAAARTAVQRRVGFDGDRRQHGQRQRRKPAARHAGTHAGEWGELQAVDAHRHHHRARAVGKGHVFKTERDEEANRALFPSNYPASSPA